MAQMNVIRMDRSEAPPLELDDGLAEARFNPFLIKDAVVYQQAKLRQGTHATKTRSMVAGSTHKLYRQKGTGYARAGDAKATQRRGGGIVHGPHPRDHGIELNKKVRKAALRSALGEKLRRREVVVVEELAPETHKTGALARWLKEIEAPRALLVTHEVPRNLELAARNLPDAEVIHHGQLNVYNLLRFDKAVFTRDALQAVQERLKP